MISLSGFCKVFMLSLTIVSWTTPVSFAHIIIRANGAAFLKKAKDDEFKPTGAGERLQSGDIIEPKTGSTMIIFCDEAQAEVVPAGTPSAVSAICPQTDINCMRTLRSSTRQKNRPGGGDPTIPYVIAPRMTFVLDDRPTLRWNAVSGAASYAIGISGPGGLIWQDALAATETKYPASAPQLESRVKYQLLVKAANGPSYEKDAGRCLGFELLPEGQAAVLRQKVQQARRCPELNDVEKAIAIAYLYDSESLEYDAIKALTQPAKTGAQHPLVYYELGGLYARIGLNLLAKDYYEKALSAYQNLADAYGEKKTQAGLSKVIDLLNSAPPSMGECFQIITPSD